MQDNSANGQMNLNISQAEEQNEASPLLPKSQSQFNDSSRPISLQN